MKLSFHRGTILRADGSSVALRFAWDQLRPEAVLLDEGGRTPYEVVRLSQDLYSSHCEEFGQIALAKTPWWAELPTPFSGSGLWMSYQGFAEGIWHDGVFGRFEASQWTDLVMPGAPFTLELGRSQLAIEDASAFFLSEKFFAQKQSLVQAVKALFPLGFALKTQVESHGSKADHVLSLLLLRLAFPEARLGILPSDVAWKRLAQNLNIEALKFPLPNVISLESFGPHEKILDLLRWQQGRSPFIPERLLASLLD